MLSRIKGCLFIFFLFFKAFSFAGRCAETCGQRLLLIAQKKFDRNLSPESIAMLQTYCTKHLDHFNALAREDKTVSVNDTEVFNQLQKDIQRYQEISSRIASQRKNPLKRK